MGREKCLPRHLVRLEHLPLYQQLLSDIRLQPHRRIPVFLLFLLLRRCVSLDERLHLDTDPQTLLEEEVVEVAELARAVDGTEGGRERAEVELCEKAEECQSSVGRLA